MPLWPLQIFDASADIMEKAFEEGAKIRREAEARKAAIAARSRAGGTARTAPGGARSTRSTGVKCASSAAAKLPWTLTAMPVPVPVALPPADAAAAPSASPGTDPAASQATAVEPVPPHEGASGDVPPTAAAPAATAAAAAAADRTATTGDAPLAKRHKNGKRGRKASEPQPPRVPLLQSGLGMLPTLMPKAAQRTEAAPTLPKAEQVFAKPNKPNQPKPCSTLLDFVIASWMNAMPADSDGRAGGFTSTLCGPCASWCCGQRQHGGSCTVCTVCTAGSTGKIPTEALRCNNLLLCDEFSAVLPCSNLPSLANASAAEPAATASTAAAAATGDSGPAADQQSGDNAGPSPRQCRASRSVLVTYIVTAEALQALRLHK